MRFTTLFVISKEDKDASLMQLLSLRTIEPWIYLRRLSVVICGLFIMSVSIVCTYRSGLSLKQQRKV